ncbi:GNAT family N-acetyltransferase [Streptomyces sp. NPDC051644]|uniref:GNAT family N-acetyltransferase n=1 Tax=Streptomyces sp. NPDC051644 TaxID=3365666 RepID=UPI00378F49A5
MPLFARRVQIHPQAPVVVRHPRANAEYAGSATCLPWLVARTGSEPIGVLLYRRYFTEAAEIHLTAVAPSWHRRDVGKALAEEVVSASARAAAGRPRQRCREWRTRIAATPESERSTGLLTFSHRRRRVAPGRESHA